MSSTWAKEHLDAALTSFKQFAPAILKNMDALFSPCIRMPREATMGNRWSATTSSIICSAEVP